MGNYNFSRRVADVPDSGIGTIMSYAARYSDVISLGQGAPQFKTPQFVYDELYARSKTDPLLGSYNSENDKIQSPLKELLIKDISEKYGFTPDRNQIYLTLGGIGGLFASLMSILEPGDEVIYFDPGYPLHLSQLALAQAKPVFVPLDEKRDWSPDMDKLTAAVTPKTKAVILTNPNNPTGTVLSREQVEQLSRIILKHNLYLVVDEAYAYLTYDRELYSPMFIPELRQRIILSKSFSKEFAMTGWRIGYVVADPEIIRKISSIHLHFSLNPATISIVAATIVLNDPRGQGAMKEFKSEITKSREVICQRMASLSKLFAFNPPHGSFYLFPRILPPGLSALDLAKRLVDEAQVITIPGDSMGPSGKGHLRLSFSAGPQIINLAFDRLESFCQKNNYC